jgi:cytochrome c oxidase cbb3-type subunit 3
MKKLNRAILIFVALLMIGAASTTFLTPNNSLDIIANPTYWLVATALFFLLIGFMATYQALDAMKQMLAQKNGQVAEVEEEPEDEQSWVDDLMHKLTDATPVDKEEEVATDHVYDGIRELDNNLPPWWLAGFYISIVFAVVYLLRFHVFQTAPLSEEEFKIEMAEAAKAKEEYLATAANLVDENSVEALSDQSALIAGGEIFTKNCAVCHANDGGGGVGPNLTDAYWLHGGRIQDIFSTIKYGVPAKGMIPWKDQMSPADMQKVASYVLSLMGTTPANPKEAQGDLFEAGSDADAAEDSSESPAVSDSTSTEETALTSL